MGSAALPHDGRAGSGALHGVPAADDAHGPLAAAARARTRRGLGDCAADDRLPLRGERARRGGRGPPRPVGARATPRHGRRVRGCGARQPRRRGGRAPRRSRAVAGGARRERRGRARIAAGGGRAPRPDPLPAVAPPLRALGLHRALVRDRLVPAHRRRREEHRVHVRHGSVRLPPGPRRRQPRRQPARPKARAAARGVPRRAARDPRDRGRGRGPPRRAAAARSRLPLVLRVLAAGPVLPARRRLERGLARSPLRPLPARPLRRSDGADGPVLRRAAARGAGRPRDERTQGRLPAGREHRRLHGGEPPDRPRPPRARRHGGHGEAARRRGRSSCSSPCGRARRG